MIVLAPHYIRKARRPSRGKRRVANADQLKLEDKLTLRATSNVSEVLNELRSVTSAKKIEKLYRAGKVDQVPKLFKQGSTRKFFANIAPVLHEAMAGGSKIAIRGIPRGFDNQSRLSIENDVIAEYVSTRTGALIKNVPDQMQEIVQNAVRTGLVGGKSPAQIAEDIYNGIGLDPGRANAVAQYEGKDIQEFRESMTMSRANMIARTEVSFAINQGSIDTWKKAVDEGMLDEGSKKVWITDPNPCPKICEEMDGVEVPLDEDFILPDGVEVPGPPAHPNCRCQTGILEPDGVKPTSNRDDDEDRNE